MDFVRLFRDSLTFLALLFCVALIGVMALPRFVDWNQHKTVLEGFISRQAGFDIRINGALQISVFPQTEIEATEVEISAKGSKLASLAFVKVAFTPTALLRGRIQITLAEANKVVLYTDALFALPEQNGISQKLPDAGVDQLALRDVTFIRANGAAVLPDPVTIRIEAPEIAGPYRLAVQDHARARDFRAQIARFEAGSALLRGVIEDAGIGARMVLEGMIARPGSSGKPLFDGSIQFNGNPILPLGEGGGQIPFEGSARLLLDPNQAIIDPITLTLGSGESAASITGRAFVDLEAKRPRVQLKLSARRVDPAALITTPQRDADTPRTPPLWQALVHVERAFTPFDPGFDAQIDLDAGGLLLPHGIAQEVSAAFTLNAGVNRLTALSMRLPGETRFTLTRKDMFSPSLIDADLEVHTAQAVDFLAFLKGNTSTDIPDLPKEMTLKSTLRSHPDGVDVSAFSLVSAAGQLEGRGRLLAPKPQSGDGVKSLPHLELSLRAAQLDARLLGIFAAPPQGAGGGQAFTLSLDLDIPALMLNSAAIGGVKLAVEQDGGALRLNTFRLTGRSGEEIILSGVLSAQETRLSGKIDAEKLDDLARLIAALSPNAGSDALLRRAALLSPARAVVQFTSEPQGNAGSVWVIGVEGKLGGTSVLVKNRTSFLPTGLGVVLEASLDNLDGGKLLAQLSGASAAPKLALPGRITLKAEGDPRRVVETEIMAALAGIDFDFSGTLVPFRLPFMLEGRSKFSSDDLSLLHTFLGEGVPVYPKGTRFTGEARLLGERWKATFTALNAKAGQMQIGGEIAFDFARSGQVAGQIKLKDVTLEALLAPVFGLETPLKASDMRERALAPPLPPLLTGDLWIEAENATLTAKPEAGSKPDFGATQFIIRFAPGDVSLEGFEAESGDARYAGTLSLSRKGQEVSAVGKVSLVRAPLPGMNSARLSGEIPFTAGGATQQALFASLAGAGQIQVEGVTIPMADPQALARLLAQPAAALGALNENNIGAQLVSELSKSPLSFPALTLPYTLVNGQLKLGQAPLDAALFPAAWPLFTPSLTLDLPRQFVEARLVMRLPRVPDGWRGAVPEISLSWSGALKEALSSPLRRNVQVASLVNGLLAGAIQRDLERTEAFDADVRERAFFLRRLKADAFTRRRNAEIDAFLKAQHSPAQQPPSDVQSPTGSPLELAPSPQAAP